jgi:hypothetical protein
MEVPFVPMGFPPSQSSSQHVINQALVWGPHGLTSLAKMTQGWKAEVNMAWPRSSLHIPVLHHLLWTQTLQASCAFHHLKYKA